MKTKTTLTFKILCTVLLTASLAYCFWYPFAYAISSLEKGGGNSIHFADKLPVPYLYIKLLPTSDSTKFSIETENKLTGEKVTIVPIDDSGEVIYTFRNTSNSIWSMKSYIFYTIFICSACVFGIAFFILFIKLIRSFSTSLIFDRTNSRRLLWMGICMISIGVFKTAMIISQVLTARAEIQLDGYEITYPPFDMECILFGIGILVMNEILRLATSIKEDQDLTI